MKPTEPCCAGRSCPKCRPTDALAENSRHGQWLRDWQARREAKK